MAHRHPSAREVTSVLTAATTIAGVGASANPEKASYGIMQMLKTAGSRVIPIDPLGIPPEVRELFRAS